MLHEDLTNQLNQWAGLGMRHSFAEKARSATKAKGNMISSAELARKERKKENSVQLCLFEKL